MITLPIPDPSALAHSEKLIQFIRRKIDLNGGFISFADFMESALYAPGLGYYSAGSHKIGKEGDFITAPEISPLFAQSIARQFEQVLTELGVADILEIGAGSGIFAKDLLLQLEKSDRLPRHYFILEVSAQLRERQMQLLQSTSPHLFERIRWIDQLPQCLSGIIFANEVMDAIPTNLFEIDEDGLKERCVAWENDQFSWHRQPVPAEWVDQLTGLQQEYPLDIGYQSELNSHLPAWICSLSDCLEKGLILLIDYGYGRAEYYHPDRTRGTLMCFYQHRQHDNPLALPGLQDITAHVDFTAVVENATIMGLKLAGYTTQTSFLLDCGILDLAEQQELSDLDLYEQNQAIKKLTLPSQMGELVKVMGLTKELDLSLIGFRLQDRRRDL